MQQITFTIDQVNQLLGMLAEIPYKNSLQPISMIQQIAGEQMQAAQQPVEGPLSDKVEN